MEASIYGKTSFFILDEYLSSGDTAGSGRAPWSVWKNPSWLVRCLSNHELGSLLSMFVQLLFSSPNEECEVAPLGPPKREAAHVLTSQA